MQFSRCFTPQISGGLAEGFHLFPFRTQQLSPHTPMVLAWKRAGRVGSRRDPFKRQTSIRWSVAFCALLCACGGHLPAPVALQARGTMRAGGNGSITSRVDAEWECALCRRITNHMGYVPSVCQRIEHSTCAASIVCTLQSIRKIYLKCMAVYYRIKKRGVRKCLDVRI